MTRKTDTEALIGRLAAEAAPVRRLKPPALRAALFLLGAGIVLAGIVAWHGLNPGLRRDMAEPAAMMSWMAALATGIAAVFAAFAVALPDRSPRWALLPVPLAMLWASGLGLGCYADWIRSGPDGLHIGDSFDCFLAILVMSLLVGGPLILLLRHARLIRPVLTAAMGGLAVASLSSAALELFHRSDARIMDIAWHVAAVALIVAIGSGAGAATRPAAKRTA